MPAVVELPPQVPAKRVLQDLTKSENNIQSASPSKRRKLAGNTSSPRKNGKHSNGHIGSSQPKSHFEEEVLEKLTQDMSGLKQKNAEKDQQWTRPSLDDFDEQSHNLCFQQIDVEEGTFNGGKTAVKLFGVTQVGILILLGYSKRIADVAFRPGTLSFCM